MYKHFPSKGAKAAVSKASVRRPHRRIKIFSPLCFSVKHAQIAEAGVRLNQGMVARMRLQLPEHPLLRASKAAELPDVPVGHRIEKLPVRLLELVAPQVGVPSLDPRLEGYAFAPTPPCDHHCC